MTVMLTVLTTWVGLSILLGALLAGMIRAEEVRSDECLEVGTCPQPAPAERRRAEGGAHAPVH